MEFAVSEMARRLGARVVNGVEARVGRLAMLDHAREGDLSFLPGSRYGKRLRLCRGTAVIAGHNCRVAGPQTLLVVRDPWVACALAAQWLQLVDKECRAIGRPGEHGADKPTLHSSSDVHSSVLVGRGAVIGAGTRIARGCVLGAGVRVGDFCAIGPNVVLSGCAALGNRVTIRAGTVIGESGFAYVRDGQRWLRLPSFGGVTIGDDVDVGANCTVDRGVLGDTAIGNGVKLDSHVHLAHDVQLGEDSALAAQVAVAGGTTIGKRCLIGGAVGIDANLRVANDVRITAMSMVTKSIDTEHAAYSSGWPATPSRSWWRQVAHVRRQMEGGDVHRVEATESLNGDPTAAAG